MGALGRGLCPIGIPEALDLNEMAVRVIRKEVVNPVLGIVSGRTIGICSSRCEPFVPTGDIFANDRHDHV
jgi:hypothetical protein